MANERTPNDPYRASDPYRPNDPYRSDRPDDELRRSGLETELQPDPELAEGPASGAKIAMFALAIAVILGAVFYGLNNSSINHAGTSPTAQNSSQTSPTAAPRPNANPGTTTAAAPAQPQSPPSSTPAGQDVNRSGNPPASK